MPKNRTYHRKVVIDLEVRGPAQGPTRDEQPRGFDRKGVSEKDVERIIRRMLERGSRT